MYDAAVAELLCPMTRAKLTKLIQTHFDFWPDLWILHGFSCCMAWMQREQSEV
jgi:hypothetical protein